MKVSDQTRTVYIWIPVEPFLNVRGAEQKFGIVTYNSSQQFNVKFFIWCSDCFINLLKLFLTLPIFIILTYMLSVIVYLQQRNASIMSEVIRVEVVGRDIVNLKNPLKIRFPVNNYKNDSNVRIPFQMFSKCPKICNNLLILFCVDINRKATNIPVNTMMNKVGGN